jgi:hypothetical protein
MIHTVISPEMEKKLLKLAAAADDHVRYGSNGSRERLDRAVNEPEIANWLVSHRMNGTAPHSTFDKVDKRQ